VRRIKEEMLEGEIDLKGENLIGYVADTKEAKEGHA